MLCAMIADTPKTAAELGLMRGSPPPPDKRVTFWNWETPPFNRWSFQHVAAFVRTERVWRGEGPVSRFERRLVRLDDLTLETAAGERVTVAGVLRRSGRQVLIVANKAESLDPDIAAADFHQLGFGAPVAISASHGEGIGPLVEQALDGLPIPEDSSESLGEDGIRVAVVGRPNVGKSTLINRLIGEERLLAFDEPGTTRDAVRVPFERDGVRYTLIDTAGVRRRARVSEAVEKFSIVKTLQAIEDAHVVVGVLDAHESVAEQDASLLGLVVEQGRALVVAVNKWDGIPPDQRVAIRDGVDLRLDFMRFAPVHFISARHGTGVGEPGHGESVPRRDDLVVACRLRARRAGGS